jgi:hypothetical protein
MSAKGTVTLQLGKTKCISRPGNAQDKYYDFMTKTLGNFLQKNTLLGSIGSNNDT